MKWLFFLLIILSTLCAFLPSASAQTINEDRSFNYGSFAITQNDAVYSMRVERNGNIGAIDPEIIYLASANSAQYDFTGFAPNTNPTYTFSPTTITGPGSNFFTLTDFDFPVNMTTDSGGHRPNRAVASTINTSGNGMPYTDGAYSGDVVLTITYP